MQDSWTREVDCRDRVGRRRTLTIYISERHEVVLSAPPGEVAVIEPGGIDRLKQACTDAQVEAYQRRGAWGLNQHKAGE